MLGRTEDFARLPVHEPVRARLPHLPGPHAGDGLRLSQVSWFDGFRGRASTPDQYRDAWEKLLANERPSASFGRWNYYEESGRVVHIAASDPNTGKPYTIWLDLLFEHHLPFVFARARRLLGASSELERNLPALFHQRKKERDNG